MTRASPAELRKALSIAHAIAEDGIDFVPIPVLNEHDKAEQLAELQRRLDEIEKSNPQ